MMILVILYHHLITYSPLNQTFHFCAAFYTIHKEKPMDDSPGYSLEDADPSLTKKADDSFKMKPEADEKNPETDKKKTEADKKISEAKPGAIPEADKKKP